MDVVTIRALEEVAIDFSRRQEDARVCGYVLEWRNDTHWLLRSARTQRVVCQYWPSANKWQKQPGGKIKHGDWSKFAEHMVRGNF